MTPIFSIITPVYNSFRLMNKYFKSLENQTFKDFEIIIVDDCSTDESYEKLLEYISTSVLNISLLKTEVNKGPGNARNIGISAAKGEWITFIDNDDWVEPYLLERIASIIKTTNVHCVIYDYYIQKKKKCNVARSMYRGQTGYVSLSECMIYTRNHTFGKFYKLSDCIKANIRFPCLRRCEDVAFVARAIDACHSIYYLNEPMYYYWQRTDSLSNNTSLDEKDLISAFEILEENLGKKYPTELKEKSLPDLLYGVLLIMCKSRISNKQIYKFIDTYEKRYPNWDKCSILNYIGLPKKIFLLFAKNRSAFMLKLIAKVHTLLLNS